jgi:hypothetical protein
MPTVVARLDAILTDTNTPTRYRPRHQVTVWAVGRDEDAARERVYRALMAAIAPALDFTPAPAAGDDFASWAMLYYQRPGDAILDAPGPSRMSWAWRTDAAPAAISRARLQIAERLIRECRLKGALPYRVIPPLAQPDILPPVPLLTPESVPSDRLAVLVLGEPSQVLGAGL